MVVGDNIRDMGRVGRQIHGIYQRARKGDRDGSQGLSITLTLPQIRRRSSGCQRHSGPQLEVYRARPSVNLPVNLPVEIVEIEVYAPERRRFEECRFEIHDWVLDLVGGTGEL